MSHFVLYCSTILALLSVVSAQRPGVPPVERLPDGIRLAVGDRLLTVRFKTDAIVRVVVSRDRNPRIDDLVVVGPGNSLGANAAIAAPRWNLETNRRGRRDLDGQTESDRGTVRRHRQFRRRGRAADRRRSPGGAHRSRPRRCRARRPITSAAVARRPWRVAVRARPAPGGQARHQGLRPRSVAAQHGRRDPVPGVEPRLRHPLGQHVVHEVRRHPAVRADRRDQSRRRIRGPAPAARSRAGHRRLSVPDLLRISTSRSGSTGGCASITGSRTGRPRTTSSRCTSRPASRYPIKIVVAAPARRCASKWKTPPPRRGHLAVVRGRRGDRLLLRLRPRARSRSSPATATLTGQASMLPHWAFGFWQSKNKYNTPGRSAEHARGVPPPPDPDRQHRAGLAVLEAGPVGHARVRRVALSRSRRR